VPDYDGFGGFENSGKIQDKRDGLNSSVWMNSEYLKRKTRL
jgi:hypothetical protein